MRPVPIAAGHWLDPAAAASYERMRAAGMPAGGINDAGRTRQEQAVLFERLGWPAAMPPGKSRHETGRALDIATASSAWAWINEHGRAHGWRRTVSFEPWHFEYELSRDQHLAAVGPTPAPLAPLPTITEDTMFIISAPGRGQAVVGPGYYRHLSSAEEVHVAMAAGLRVEEGNDREYDVMVSIALTGAPADAVDERALAAALAPLITTQAPQLPDADLARIARAVNDEQARRLAS